MPSWLYLLPIVAINVCASLLLKYGAGRPPAALLGGFASFWTLWGLFCFGAGGLLYAWVLRYVSLGVAQAVLALQYVFNVAGAWCVLGEKMDWLQVTGFVLIGAGIACVVCRQGA